MYGKRIFSDEEGRFPSTMEPGSYGCATNDRIKRTFAAWWSVCTPDGSVVQLDPNKHTVTEHEDGSISVWPSITTRDWYGWLVAGVWTEHHPMKH